MSLFGNKIERTLQKCKKKQLPLTVRYRDGNQPHTSEIVRVDRDRFLLVGFAETLREEALRVAIEDLAIFFDTVITHKTHDLRGRVLYYCAFPESFQPLANLVERYFVYPKGVIALAESSLEDLLGEEKELELTRLYLWAIGPKTVDILNSKGRVFEKGQNLPNCEIFVGKVSSLAALKVVTFTERQHGKETVQIVKCALTAPLGNEDELMKLCRRIDRL